MYNVMYIKGVDKVGGGEGGEGKEGREGGRETISLHELRGLVTAFEFLILIMRLNLTRNMAPWAA